MRILINTINFSPELTSTGKYTGEMAAWLAERGHAVRVATTPPHYPQWRISEGYSRFWYKKEKWTAIPESTGEIEVFRCPAWIPRMPRGWRRLLYLASFSLSCWPIMLKQIAWRPDVVLLIEPTFFCCPQTLCVARLSGATAWLHVQDFEVDVAFELGDFSSSLLKQFIQKLERFLLRKFKRVSAISDRMVERLSAKGVDAVNTALFPNWVDTSEIYPLTVPNALRKEIGIPETAIVALYSGNMGLKQGLNLLIEASRLLDSRSDIVFVLCGAGPYRDTLMKMASGAANVRFLPLKPTDQLNELLNMADIHLLPQVVGAADLVMPSKLTGILASGKPVVATAGEGTQLAKVLAGRGFCARPGDAIDLASAVARLADDRELRQRMGQEARKYAITHLNRDQILTSFESSLLEACGRSVSGTPVCLSATEHSKLPIT
jgi:colanic acid biosynthesis glycosyl transferase WcaI